MLTGVYHYNSKHDKSYSGLCSKNNYCENEPVV